MMQIGIIGAGTMGRGIAQVAAQAGWEVYLYDNDNSARKKAKTSLAHFLQRLMEKGKLRDSKAVLDRIQFVDSLEKMANSQLIIEAIAEDLELKKSVFWQLESIVSETCIMATNTSALSVTAIAAACRYPKRIIGLHFFNPAPLMRLVECVKTLHSRQDVVDKACTWMESWGKEVVIVKDSPGFIVNKVARPYYREAQRIVEEGGAGIGELDKMLKEYGHFKMGPFELMDLIGLDINLAATKSVYQGFYQDRRYIPSILQQKMVEAGWLGKKTNKGYYEYPRSDEDRISLDDVSPEYAREILERIIALMVNEAFDTRFRGIALADHIDKAMKLGANHPKGPFEWCRELGPERVVRILDDLYERYREERYRCCPLLRDELS